MSDSIWISRAVEGLEKLAECSYKDLLLIHSPPHRSITFGASGIAYAFWKAACTLDSPNWLNQARFLIDHVAAAPEDGRHAELPPHEGGVFDVQIEDSFYYGNRGIMFTQALIGMAEDNPHMYEKALRSFISPESERSKHQELLQGIAGRLLGCALLYHQTRRQDIKAFGDLQTQDLISTANNNDHNLPWAENHRLGMAHGRAGNYYALLCWANVSGYPLPDWVREGLSAYAKSAVTQQYGISWPIDERDPGRYMNSWCNGAPGMILLWGLAYELYNDDLFLTTARKAGEYCAHEHNHTYGHICCGAAGPGYAMLCLHRHDPQGAWLDHAYRFGEQSWQGMMVKHWRMSLYNGLAGMVCFMLDLDDPANARQPVFEL